MNSLFEKLQDPQLVVAFQQACGVRGVEDGSSGDHPPAGSRIRPAANGTNHVKDYVDNCNGSHRANGDLHSVTEAVFQRNGTVNGHKNPPPELRDRLKKNGTVRIPGNGSNEATIHDEVTRGAVGNGTENGLVGVAARRDGTGIHNGDCKIPETHQETANGNGATAGYTFRDTTTTHLNTDGVTPTERFHVGNKFLHTIFSFGAELGNESFYIVFYPYFFFNIDAWMARRVCWFWCLFMYAGQAAKDIIKWPRPPSPPVFRLERKYALEYGMPSTHAMVGAGMPFCLFFLTLGRYEYPWPLGFAITFAWFALVCVSRIYLGMHSILDVLVGIASVLCMLPVWLYVMNPLDDFVMTHPLAPWLSILGPLTLCLCYPKLDQWSTARGDTTLVVGVGAGVAFAQWFRCQYGLNTAIGPDPPYNIPALTSSLMTLHLLRMFVGGLLALVTRAVFKFGVHRVSCWCVGVDPKDPTSKQRLGVELPTKFITYVVMGFNTLVVAPLMFTSLGIERAVY